LECVVQKQDGFGSEDDESDAYNGRDMDHDGDVESLAEDGFGDDDFTPGGSLMPKSASVHANLSGMSGGLADMVNGAAVPHSNSNDRNENVSQMNRLTRKRSERNAGAGILSR
jgi:hypothetical protein